MLTVNTTDPSVERDHMLGHKLCHNNYTKGPVSIITQIYWLRRHHYHGVPWRESRLHPGFLRERARELANSCSCFGDKNSLPIHGLWVGSLWLATKRKLVKNWSIMLANYSNAPPTAWSTCCFSARAFDDIIMSTHGCFQHCVSALWCQDKNGGMGVFCKILHGPSLDLLLCGCVM